MIGKRARKKPSVLHPKKRYPISAAAYKKLKMQVFERSRGLCEEMTIKCSGWLVARCNKPITLETFDAHHVIARSKGGQDTLENLLAICRDCHEEIHGKLKWSKRDA